MMEVEVKVIRRERVDELKSHHGPVTTHVRQEEEDPSKDGWIA